MRKFLVIITLLAALLSLQVGRFYAGEIRHAFALAEREGLPRAHANAFQHSHAAAKAYEGLRWVLPPAMAECAVIGLGLMNEYIEIVLKRDDSTLEIMKDLHNNQVGVTTARWLEAHDAMADLDAMLVAMAADGTLLLASTDVPVPLTDTNNDPASAQIREAHRWYNAERARITADANAVLARAAH